MKPTPKLLALGLLLPVSLAGAQPRQSERPRVPEGATAYYDLAYVTNGHRRQKLDLYLPKDGQKLPLIINIHGGAWLGGSKEMDVPLDYLAHGYAVASINYRLSHHALFPAQIEDCKAAVRWLRANATNFSLDPAHFAAWGKSAGGHLAALLGTTGDGKTFDVGENLDVSSRVQAVVDYFGPTDLLQMDAHRLADGQVHDKSRSPESLLIGGPLQENKDKAARANPITYLKKDAPPFLICHGDADPAVPHHQSELLEAALKQAGVPVTFYTVKGAGHGGFKDPRVPELTQAFLAKYLKEAMEPIKKASYVPPPQPVKTTILVGAHNCPLWEADAPQMWDQARQHPERTPLLGFYDQANPEVADWETKWAVEHGINFFVYCWYRAGRADAVETKYSSAIEALLKSRYVNQFKFTIMWENQQRGPAWGASGVSNEKELLDPLTAFWITNYFSHPSYLKIDNKPVLFFYDAHRLAADLGGATNVPKAFDQMRAACRRAGFDGLYLLVEYRGLDPRELQFRKDMGFDYTFAYVWPISKPQEAVPMQLDFIRKTRDLKIIPEVVTVSQGWTGWRNEGPLYRITPADFEGLLRQAKDILATMPQTELGSKLLLLDNWNEWSEGHYLAPHREYGFGYLDAVRKVFSDAPEGHKDLIPEDLGLGPYDIAYKPRPK
jgi:acetyl esterase/lipase